MNEHNWSSLDDFLDLLRKEDKENEDYIVENDLEVITLYAYYHYFNADVTKIEEMLSGVVHDSNSNLQIAGIFQSLLDDNSVDFLSLIDEQYYKNEFISNLENELHSLAEKMAYIIVKTPFLNNESAIEVYTTLNIPFNADNCFVNRILCDFEIPVEDKIKIQTLVSNYSVKQKNIKFEILFKDEIQQEIDDIESPKEYVFEGRLSLTNPKSICYFGNEKSFITTISAESLKKMYYEYGNRGLFDSNLRYFVSSKKIDPKIIDSIKTDNENFVYYNNGIIITCDDYSISKNTLILKNFSIVNGGQTTNLIGRTDFDKDFSLICKVIKNKYDSVEQRFEFLSKVAEASNTQKPINAKDLIANRKEQRLLKLQFERAGIFLRVKRGEKIDKSLYKASWQNASNDEVAQFIYSIVFQCPGSSKNSKSKLLETERIYRIIFDSEYSDNFFVSLQYLKVAYSEWIKVLKKKETKSSTKYALAKNAFLITIATFGLIYKAAVNEELKKYLFSENNITNENQQLKMYLQQNDIGKTSIFTKNFLDEKKKNSFYALFEMLFGHILIPAYDKFKKANPTYAYSHFVKSDTYYYNYVVACVVDVLKTTTVGNDILRGTERQKILIDYSKIEKEQSSLSKPGLEQELIDLRRKVYHESNKVIQAYEVVSNRQLANIMKYLPKNTKDLAKLCGFKSVQVEKYGAQIISIIEKYTNIDDLV